MSADGVPSAWKLSRSQGHRFIISIDYGTTYTGAAWALTTGVDPELETIETVNNWQNAVQAKVPSKVTYTSCEGPKWGYNIGPDAFVLKLTKLELPPPSLLEALGAVRDTLFYAKSVQIDPQTNVVTSEVPPHLTKSSEQIITKYLTYVARYVRDDIISKKQGDAKILADFPIDLVITHPAEWDPRAKNITFRSVNNAFRHVFHEMRDKPGHIRMATEPEACAQYTMKDLQNQGIAELRKGDCFVVVDAGGGTVDLVSYIVLQVAPNFRVSQITPASGKRCGATLIDEYFTKKFLKERLGKEILDVILERDRSRPRNRSWRGWDREMLERFDVPIKQKFAGRSDDELEPPVQVLDFPPMKLLGLPNLPDDRENGIIDGQLMITCDDLEKMFQQSVQGTINLINRQVAQIEQKGHTATAIFLSGGFSESQYLLRQIKAHAERKSCAFHCAGNRWTAVAKGAVLMGLGAGCDVPPAQLQCPVNIGVVVSARFNRFDHEDSQAYQDILDGETRAKNHIKWVVRKGDLVDSGSGIDKTVKVRRKFTLDGSKAGRVIVVVSQKDLLPNQSHVYRAGDTDSSGIQVINLDYDLEQLHRGTSGRAQRDPIMPQDPSRGDPYNTEEMQVKIHLTQQGGTVELVSGPNEEGQEHWLDTRDLHVSFPTDRLS